MYNLQFSCELESCCFDENSKSTDKFIKSIIVWSGSFFSETEKDCQYKRVLNFYKKI